MFITYPDLTNHYQQKSIKVFLGEFPLLAEELFTIDEKLHGTNIQLIFEPNRLMLVGSRNRILDFTENFFGIFETLLKYKQELEVIQKYCNENDQLLNLYGELFGPGVQKGVDYGLRKRIRVFHLRINKRLISSIEFNNWLYRLEIAHLRVPHLGLIDGLENALNFDTEIPSVLSEMGDLCEGVVIQPFNTIYKQKDGDYIILKKKNEKFKEKQKAKKQYIPEILSEEVEYLMNEFHSLINRNRLESVYSKEGMIKDSAQIGYYIKLVMEDATKELFLDETIKARIDLLDKKEKKIIFNVGNQIARMLMEDV